MISAVSSSLPVITQQTGGLKPACSQVLVVGHSFKALPEDEGAAGTRDKGVAAAGTPEVGVDPIDVPRCRQLSKARKGSDGTKQAHHLWQLLQRLHYWCKPAPITQLSTHGICFCVSRRGIKG